VVLVLLLEFSDRLRRIWRTFWVRLSRDRDRPATRNEKAPRPHRPAF